MSGLLQSGLATELGLPSGKTGGREGAVSQTVFSHVPCRHVYMGQPVIWGCREMQGS